MSSFIFGNLIGCHFCNWASIQAHANYLYNKPRRSSLASYKTQALHSPSPLHSACLSGFSLDWILHLNLRVPASETCITGSVFLGWGRYLWAAGSSCWPAWWPGRAAGCWRGWAPGCCSSRFGSGARWRAAFQEPCAPPLGGGPPPSRCVQSPPGQEEGGRRRKSHHPSITGPNQSHVTVIELQNVASFHSFNAIISQVLSRDVTIWKPWQTVIKTVSYQ